MERTASGLRRLRAAAVGAVAALIALAAPAAEPPPADAAPMRTELLKTGLYQISGGGANSLLRLSAQGLILVDAKPDASYRELRAQMRRVNRIADLPLRVLLLTNPDDSHSGGAARFLAAGVPIVVPAGGRFAIAAAPAASAASAAPAAPAASTPGGRPVAAVTTFERQYDIALGGATVRLLHFGSARGASDVVVWFPDLKVVAVGELYTAGEPQPIVSEGGSRAAWAAAVGEILKLDFDLVVPARGPPIRRAELEAFHATRLAGAPRN